MDTSVVIDDIRGKDAKLQSLVSTLPVAICGCVRAEILCGARDAAHRAKLIANLAAYQHVPFPELLWDIVGDNLAALRRHGLTLPLADVVVATLGIHIGIEVWARDRHFADMQKALPSLKLFQEPP